MLSYLAKFSNLPEDLRAKVSSPEVMAAINELEKAYGVNLAVLVIKVMVKEVAVADLDKYFSFEYGLNAEQAAQLADEFKRKVLFGVADYLGIKTGEAEAKNLKQWLIERKKEVISPASDFYYSPEDEEEVKALAKKVNNLGAAGAKKDKEKSDIERIIKEAGLTFSADDLKNRFVQVMRTYLIGIRGKIDARAALTKAAVYGGLELTDEQAEKVLKIAEAIKNENLPVLDLKPLKRIPIAEGQSVNDIKTAESNMRAPETNNKLQNQYLNRDLAYDFSRLAGASKNIKGKEESSPEKKLSQQQAEIFNTKQAELTDRERTKNQPVDFSSFSEKKEQVGEKDNKKNNEIMAKVERILKAANIKQDNLKNSQPKIAFDVNQKREETPVFGGTDRALDNIDTGIIVGPRRTKPIDGKVKMDDVKYRPKLMGPIDELKEMDLVNFRRLDSDASKAAAKIKEKIDFLEDENYSRRLAGIKAWRQSPVMQLYLAIGQESILNKKPINDIIDERKKNNREYITNQEFTAIMDLNKELRN